MGMIVIDSNMAKVPNICNECYANLWGGCCIAPAEEDGLCVQGGKPDWCPIKELVQCKDCKMRDNSHYCNWIEMQVTDDFSCIDGVKNDA